MRPSLTAAVPGRGRRLLLVNAAFGRSELLYAPVGLLRLNAAVQQRCAEVDSRVVVCNAEDAHDHQRGIDTYLSTFQPAVVGISTLSAAMPWALELAGRVRRHNPEIPVVLGGYHATSYPEGIGKYGDIDYYVRGEATLSGPALFDCLLEGAPECSNIHGLSYRGLEGTPVHTPSVEPPSDLDQNPAIRWTDLDASLFADRRSSALTGPHLLVRFPTLLAPCTVSQGCPRRCGFCERISGRRFRQHSPERVLSDLGELHATLGSTWVNLGDDAVSLNREWFLSLLRALEEGPPLHYWTGVNADCLDRDVIDRMVAAGVGILSCFPESGSERVRGILHKPIAMDRLVENMEYASSQGILILATFILGAPGETLAEAEQTIALARQPVFDLVGFNQLILFGTTSLGRHLAELGIEPDTPEYFAYLNAPSTHPIAAYSSEEINRLSIVGKRLNLEKLSRPEVRAKLECLGLEVEMNLPRQDLHGEATEHISTPEDRPAEVAELEEPCALPTSCADLVAALAAPDFAPITACLERSQPPALRIQMGSPAGEMTLWVSSRDVQSYFRRTAFFALSYQGRGVSRSMERLLAGVLERLAGWETHSEYCDEVRALMSP